MRLALEQHSNAIYLTFPPADVGTALYYAAFSGLTGRTFPGLFSSLSQTVRVKLPLASWRNVLRDLADGYARWSAKLNGGDTITWALDGQDYLADAELPEMRPINEVLGQFELAGNILLLSDPHLHSCSVESARLTAKRGTWHARGVLTDGYTGMGVGRLTVYHDTLGEADVSPEKFPEAFDAIISVESTLAGVFDDARVPGREGASSRTPFEQECWNATDLRRWPSASTREAPGGVLVQGVAVSAKNGDGRYGCYVIRDAAGQAVAVQIDFETNVCWPEEQE